MKNNLSVRGIETNASVIARAIERLSPRQQAVIGLRMIKYTQQDITTLLGVSRTTVWSDEITALGKLKNILGPDID